MGKRYLRSDLSPEEARFFTCGGRLFVGTGNVQTALIKYIGMYTELDAERRTSEIASYNPDNDNVFKYENIGYTELRKEIKKAQIPISRRYIKGISRKWPMSSVVISFNAVGIISALFTYIANRKELKVACSSYIRDYIKEKNIQTEWDIIMPIQFDFLGTRIQDHHENWQIAEPIVSELLTLTMEGRT